MSKQRNRHRRNRQRMDNPEQNGVSTGNDGENNNHHAKSVVTTNVTKKNQNNDKQRQNNDEQRRNDNNNNNQQNRQSEGNSSSRRNRKRRNRRKKNKNSKLRNVRQEDLFQLKDPKRARKLQNKKKRPRNFVPYSVIKAESTICPICEKKIENMADTITDRRTGQPAHFVCVHDSLMKTLSLRDNQRLSYMGSGVFAVIEDQNEEGKPKFKIKEKFEYVK
ncbi:MAG: hypothetical protein II707_07505 [Spirochaetales bacterium]|nr:hypothetical protein [Spirochaetales bacterium]